METAKAINATGRYLDLGRIGKGGMGAVHRVFDRVLNRTMAMKVVRAKVFHEGDNALRFIEEAQATAQLQHPGIVPVHDLAKLHDSRFYFTMQEIRGQTLTRAIYEVHKASPGLTWDTAPQGWTFRKLIDVFHKTCETVAYAHSLGVIHRDLKPSNVMLGSFGEVLVLDWGLIKVGNASQKNPLEASFVEQIVTERSKDDSQSTIAGTISGTPPYMAPEQAAGRNEQMGPPADVYSLGAILYQILCGRAPYFEFSGIEVLRQVLTRPPRPLRAVCLDICLKKIAASPTLEGASATETLAPELLTKRIPEELEAICVKAMSRDIQGRYANASELADAVSAWLEDSMRREKALKVIREAEAIAPEVEKTRAAAEDLRRKAAQRLTGVKAHEPIAQKLPGWKLEDEAIRLEQEAALMEVRYLQTLHGALATVPDLPEGLQKLADYYYTKHMNAEAARNENEAERQALQLRLYDRGRYAAYLKGEGALTLETDPPGADVTLYRYETHQRRLEPRIEKYLGRSPIRELALPKGSYLLEIEATGCQKVCYPIHIDRQRHWDGIRPGETSPYPIYLPRLDELGPHDVYVPAGWFIGGGDREAFNSITRRRLWVNGFAIRRFPVTNREYLAFLNDLVEQGLEERALELAPRERGGASSEAGAMIYGRDQSGTFVLRPDAEGDLWLPDWPVVMMNWYQAAAYAEWESARSGRPWRLPSEWEWEKAARGVDGRFYPWGDFADPCWARIMDSQKGRPCPSVLEKFTTDESPYGVRGMGGNVRDWCLERFSDPLPEDGSHVSLNDAVPGPEDLCLSRGGSWIGTLRTLRSACRNRFFASICYGDFGFRLARTIPL